MGKILLAGFLALLAIGMLINGIASAFGGGDDGGKNPEDYSSCVDLDASLGVDLDSAECVDDDGHVVFYKDTLSGQARLRLRGR